MKSEVRTHRSFCRFCPAFCGVLVTTCGDRVERVVGDPEHPVSRGYTCPKGRALGAYHHHPKRLDYPLVRRSGKLVRVSWDECLDDLGERLIAIREESGPDAIGLYMATAGTKDAAGYTVASKLLPALGSRSSYSTFSIDAPGKFLVSELMSGYPVLLPAVDYDAAGMLLLLGTNPVVSHGHTNSYPDPVRMLRRIAARGDLWVVDPRRTESARLASRHLAPIPGSDYALVGFLVRELLRDGADREYLDRHTEGVDELTEAVEALTLERAARTCGIPESDLLDLLASVRRHHRLAVTTATGVSMTPAANVCEWLVFALLIITGSFDRPGGVWVNPGFLNERETHAYEPMSTVGPGAPSRPELPSLLFQRPCAAMADEIEAGHLRALFVVGGNPVLALPGAGRLVDSLRRLDVLAVADVVETETTALATHVLPSGGQLERADLPGPGEMFHPVVATQYTPAIVPLTHDRRPMWRIFAQIGQRIGLDLMPGGLDPERASDDEVLAAAWTCQRSTFEDVRSAGTAVVASTSTFGWVHDRVLPHGRWKLAPTPLVTQLRELLCSPRVPPSLVLVPRRQPRHMNSTLSDGISVPGRRDTPDILVHSADASELGLCNGQRAVVRSQHGSLVGTVRVDDRIRQGAISVPHGYGKVNVGSLTSGRSDVDRLTGMPWFGALPVSVSPVEPTG